MFLCVSVAGKQILPEPGHSNILLRKESSAPNHFGCGFSLQMKYFLFFKVRHLGLFRSQDARGCLLWKTRTAMVGGAFSKTQIWCFKPNSGMAKGQPRSSSLTPRHRGRASKSQLTYRNWETGIIFGIPTHELKYLKACGGSSDERNKYIAVTTVSVCSGKWFPQRLRQCPGVGCI